MKLVKSIQRVPALRGFWDLKKTVLREICVIRTVGDPLLTRNPPLARTLTTVHTVKSKVKISQNFVAFSEYMNFKPKIAVVGSAVVKTA